jgi:hypothetical protein
MRFSIMGLVVAVILLYVGYKFGGKLFPMVGL